MMDTHFQIELAQVQDYRFVAMFDDPRVPYLVTDEPRPLGGGSGPNPARLLVAAVANCLAASLLFALRKFGNEAGPLRAVADCSLARNEDGRMRVVRIGVELRLGVPAGQLNHAARAVGQFEQFCVVTQSVRTSIPVEVSVVDSQGLPVDAQADTLTA